MAIGLFDAPSYRLIFIFVSLKLNPIIAGSPMISRVCTNFRKPISFQLYIYIWLKRSNIGTISEYPYNNINTPLTMV